MTRSTFARWTCNVCKFQKETASDKQPKGWIGYGFTTADTPNGEQKTLGHLCPRCATNVQNVMTPVDAPSPIRDAPGGQR